MKSIDIALIIPFLNEEENLKKLGVALYEFTEKNNSLKFEVILVNDGSTDNSIKVIKESVFPSNTRLINLSQNFGSHAALRAGIQKAKAKFIAFVYADLQDPLTTITLMYEKIIEGKDIIWANRVSTKNSYFEEKFSQIYSALMQKYVNRNYPDKGFDVLMFNSKIQEELNKNIESNSSIFLQILNLGFKSGSIVYEKKERQAGKSKWTFSKKIKLFIDSFVAFSYFPIRLVSISGIVFFLLGILWTIYIIVRRILINDLESGWPALTSILLIGFGITNIALGIIAEYLWRTLDASRKRPVFIVSDIIDIR